MKAVFVETEEFTRQVTAELPDGAFLEVQLALMNDPESGVVMPGCGGCESCGSPIRGGGVGSAAGGG